MAPPVQTTSAEPVAPAVSPPGAALPPPSAEPRYAGLWAVDAQACADPAWRFEARRLSTKGEVSCDFDAVRRTAAGYEIDATCVAQAPPQKHRLTLTFAESAKAMLVDGGPFGAPVGLIWCGPPRP